MKIHALQLDPVWEDKAATFAKVNHLLEAAPPEPGSLIVLPEMFATGFTCRLEATAEAAGGATERFLKHLAERYGSAVVGGLVSSGPQGKGLNQALAISPAGEILTRYTKIHPFTGGGEGAVHEPGSQVTLFEWQGWKIAPLVCYDLRFPELARQALELGAELLIYIAAWPARRHQHWLTLLQARAIENQAYVLGVNRCGQEPDTSYCGRTVLVDPWGVMVADASDGEKILTTSAEKETVRQWRQDFPAVSDYLARSGQTEPASSSCG